MGRDRFPQEPMSSDELLSLAQVQALLPSFRNGRRPSIQTLRIWARTGALEARRIRGVHFVTRESLRRFLEGRAAAIQGARS